MKNAVGREIPEFLLTGGREVYQGKNYMDGKYVQKASPRTRRYEKPQESKLVDSLAQALRQCGARSGMTFSFHHHLRDGDYVVNMVMKAAIDPTEILLIVDAMIGQDAVNAAKAFDDALDIDGVVLTKLDGDARGGAALSIKAVTGKPIKFAGVGEKLDQIEVFHPDRMASRILGMGDVLSLIEKAEQNFDRQKALELQEKLRKNKFTLTDFYEQMAQIKNMGSLSELAGMLPGVKASDLEGASMDNGMLQQMEAIILSMTPYERENPSVLNSSRKKRIAAGSGTQVVDVNRLLKQFEMLQSLTKQFSGGKMPRNMRKLMGKKGGLMGGGMPGGLPF